MFTKKYSKTAMRGVEILVHLSETGRPLRAAEIADSLEIARSSADQLLKSMVEAGYLLLSPYNKTYSPSPRLARLGAAGFAGHAEYPRLQEAVSGLHDTLGEIVTLTIQNDCYMQILEITGPNFDPTLAPGARVPIIGSAAGAAALSTQSPKQIRRILLRSRYHALPLSPPGEAKAFFDSLGYFRQVGYSSWPTRRPVADWEQYDKDYLTVAVNVPARSSEARIVLSTTGRAADYKRAEKSLAKLLRSPFQQPTSTGAFLVPA